MSPDCPGGENKHMAAGFRDVVLSPARDGDTIVFAGTGLSEHVTFDNPHAYEFGVALGLSGGNDRLTETEVDILNARVSTGAGADTVGLDVIDNLTIGAGTGDDRLSLGS